MSIKYNGKTVAGNYKISASTTASDTKAGPIKIATEQELKDTTNNKVAVTPYLLNKALSSINRGLKIGRIGIGFINESQQQERYLNGQVIIQDQFESFTTWVKDLIKLYPNLSCTNEEFETACSMSTYAQCGKFVVDDNAGSIRLPKVVNVQGLFDLTQAGLTVEAGLPNITGSFSNNSYPLTPGSDNVWSVGGAIEVLETKTASQSITVGNANQTTPRSVGINASLSNPIYGNSTTVQEEAVQYPYYIVVAIGVETPVDVTRELELNNPFSLLEAKWSDKLLNNISWLRSQGQVNSSKDYVDAYNLILREYNSGTNETETVGGVQITFRRGSETNMKVTTNKVAYDNILNATGTAWYFVLDQSNSAFYLPQTNGFFQFGGDGNFVEAGLPNITGTIQTDYLNQLSGAFYTYKADVTGNGGSGSDGVAGFDASRSNPIYGNSNTVQPNAVKGYLYFYVGETVQNSNLINAGRIEEKVADFIPHNRTVWDGQWVTTYTPLTTATAITSGVVYLDLTDILPSDGFNYEITGYWKISRDDTGGTDSQCRIYNGTYRTADVHVDGNNQRAVTAFTTVIDITRKNLGYEIYANALGTGYLILTGYRRLGTNQ